MRAFKKGLGFLFAAMMICALPACGTQNESAPEVTRMAPSAAGSDYIDNDAEAEDVEAFDDYEAGDEAETTSDNAQMLSANFDEAYIGPYSDTQHLLLGFNEKDGCGMAAIMSNDGEKLDWVCVGDWTNDGNSHTFDDGENPNVVSFTVESSTDNGLRINWMGEGFLDLEDADPQMITDFFTAVDAGEFQ